MPPAALSPSGRVRSRTSDISDFLRGRHDPKTSTDLQSPPPLPNFIDPVTPPKQKSKFAFLARKRKSSFTPTKTGASAAIAATAAATIATSATTPRAPVASSSQSSPAGPSVRTSSRDLPPLPPLSIIAPGYRHPNSDPARQKPTSPPPGSQIPHYAPQPGLIASRKQKGSSESTRHSTDSRASLRPIITVSPPHNAMNEDDGAYTSPRTPPQPSGPPSPLRNSNASLPTPAASDGTADSPTSATIPTPSTSTHSLANLPDVSAPDASLAMATSYKEEMLLRKDHFEIGESDMQPRRGTISVNKSQPPPATVGFSPSRHERRHISVVQLNRLKNEVVGKTPPRIRKVPSASSSLAEQNARQSASLARSNTISSSPTQPQGPSQGSRSPTPQGRKVPPPLKRTWHTPPITGPPKEPLPSPPTGSSYVQTPTTADSFRTAHSPSSSPISPRRTLPPLSTSTRDTGSSRAQGAKSPDSLTSQSIPSSPARSEADAPSLRTPVPVREDPAQRILADERATPAQLRDALRTQSEKYARLSAYLLSLTERHAHEKAELIRKIEALEQGAARREREMRGLRWLVDNANANSAGTKPGPARADSNTLPGPGKSAKARDRSTSTATTRSHSHSHGHSAAGSEGRMSFDSPAGSVEEGIAELQTTISEFIAPLGLGSASSGEHQHQLDLGKVGPSAWAPQGPGSAAAAAAGRTRTRRSNTVPNGLNGVPQLQVASASAGAAQGQGQAQPASARQKQARRTSSPLISSPSMNTASPPSKRPSVPVPARTAGSLGKTAGSGLGLGLGLATRDRDRDRDRDGSSSPPALSRASTPDRHARADSSTLSSLPSLSTLSSASSGLSSIPETPRTDVGLLPALDEENEGAGAGKRRFATGGSMIPSPSSSPKRLSSSTSTSSSVSASSGSGTGSSAGSSRVSASPSIGQVLDRSRRASHQQQQPEMDAILRRLRAFGHGSRSS